jgi:hypothetical protein
VQPDTTVPCRQAYEGAVKGSTAGGFGDDEQRRGAVASGGSGGGGVGREQSTEFDLEHECGFYELTDGSHQ